MAQTPAEPSVIAAEVSADAYAVYSVVIDHPKLSHADTAKRYLIKSSTGFNPDTLPSKCVSAPPQYQSSFQEIVSALAKRQSDSFRLERKFNISKPYEILNSIEGKQFEEMTMNPSLLDGSRDDVDKFRGGTDIIQLGNIYFDRSRTLAMVHVEAWCGGLCGLSSWRILEKTGISVWHELAWETCSTIARLVPPQVLPQVQRARDK